MRTPECHQPILPIFAEETVSYTQLHSLEETAQTGERSRSVTLSMNEVEADIADAGLKRALWEQFGTRTAPQSEKKVLVIANSDGRLHQMHKVKKEPLQLYPKPIIEG